MIADGRWALAAAGVAVLVLTAQRPPGSAEQAYRANNVGVARLEQFDYPAAAAAFREALTAHRDLPVAHLNLAIALYYAGEIEGARRAAEAARRAFPELPHAHYVTGLIERADDRLDRAREAFEQVRRLDAADVGAAINLGQIHLQEGRHEEAAEAFRIAVRAEPFNVTAAYGLAMALTRSGVRDEAAAAMRRFQHLRESTYATAFSQNYLEQGRYAEALVSSGAEPELVERRTPDVAFRPDVSALRASPPATAQEPRDDAGAALGLALFDLDGDGDLDVIEAGPGGVRVHRNDAGRFTEVTGLAGLSGVEAARVLVGDYDNDGRADLCLLGRTRVMLYRQVASWRFENTRAPGLVYDSPSGAAAWLDVDHDGDLDLWIGAGEPDAASRLFRNNGDGTFTDVTSDAGLAHSGRIAAAVPTDYDNRRDIDLLVGAAAGPVALFRNLRDGRFGDVAAETGLRLPADVTAVAAADVNKDGFTDFYFGSASAGSFALSDGRGGFTVAPAPLGGGVRAALFLDYDNDGLVDLVAATDRGLQVLRNLGTGRPGQPGIEWADTTGRARDAGPDPGDLLVLAAGDLDGDGDVDLVTGGSRPVVWWNEGGERQRSLRVQLTSRVSNRSAAGAKVEIRAGSLLQKLEVYAASPAPAPADLVFGLGERPGAEVVRVLWPAGILQAEVGESEPGGPPTTRTGRLAIEELDRKPSSCPYLYAWSGERFEFVTDFLGGGEMGYWVAPGVRNTPDPDEYVRIDARQLVARDGRYELRVTNELEEALFLDRVQLVVVDHPSHVEAYPAEGMTASPRPFAMHYATDTRPPLAAFDDRGGDVLDRVATLDRRYADSFPLAPVRGYARPHALTLRLPPGERRLLLLTGWTDYAFSGDNVAAHQAGLQLVPPSLEIKGADGRWMTALENVGVPVGRPQTVVVDLARLPSAVEDVRISTTMRIYWDQVRVARAAEVDAPMLTRLDPVSATLRWRGFSAERADGREPLVFDYDRVSVLSPWKTMPGRYTREGDVGELLVRADDMFVVSPPGDEVALSFDATAVPVLPAGWTRTFLLYAVGFSKEMDLSSSGPDQLAPLPFHGMSAYPYPPSERYPSTAAHQTYLARYNTRVVRRAIPSLDLLLERLATERATPASP